MVQFSGFSRGGFMFALRQLVSLISVLSWRHKAIYRLLSWHPSVKEAGIGRRLAKSLAQVGQDRHCV